MVLSLSMLRRAKVENLERLARALGVRVTRGVAYEESLIHAIALMLRREAIMDELRRLPPRT